MVKEVFRQLPDQMSLEWGQTTSCDRILHIHHETETTHLDLMNVDDDLSDPDLSLDSDPNLFLTDFDYDAEIN